MRIFYASDIHGSEVCWRKFLNAGRFYRADALIMGGDLVGKALVPIVVSANGDATVTWAGRTETLDGDGAIRAVEKSIRDAGFYPARVVREHSDRLEVDDEVRVELFDTTVTAELARWMTIAEEKVKAEIPVYVIAGNDDPWFIDEILAASPAIIHCDDRTAMVGEFEMISLSYSNPTPWDSPRELPEDELFGRIDGLASTLQDPARAIFNLHVPPYKSGLDEAALLDEEFRPRTHLGAIETGPVGSTAVRRAIEQYQPMVGVHGHIHESRGVATIGRTVVINPGSEYTSGRIHGALIETRNGAVRRHQLIIG